MMKMQCFLPAFVLLALVSYIHTSPLATMDDDEMDNSVNVTHTPTCIPSFGSGLAWTPYKNMWYASTYGKASGNWWQMEEWCGNADDQGRSNLAHIKNSGEQKIVQKLIKSCGSNLWIGGARIARDNLFWYKNLDEEYSIAPIEYSHWQSGQPSNSDNEEYVFINYDAGKWYDQPCDSGMYAVCELRC